MGWQEARDKHRAGGSLNALASEDLIARRVLKGMGLVQARLYDVEHALHIRDTSNTPLWERTLEVFRQVALRSGIRKFGYDRTNPGMFEIELKEVGPHHKEIMELVPLFEALTTPPYPLFLTRLKGTQQSWAYFVLERDGDGSVTVPWLQPPFTVIKELESGFWLAVQETEKFIAQFGPYQSPLSEQE